MNNANVNIDNLKLLRAALAETLRQGQRLSQILEAAQKNLALAGELVERAVQLSDKIIADLEPTDQQQRSS